MILTKFLRPWVRQQAISAYSTPADHSFQIADHLFHSMPISHGAFLPLNLDGLLKGLPGPLGGNAHSSAARITAAQTPGRILLQKA